MSERSRHEQSIIITPERQVSGVEFGALPKLSDREVYEGTLAFVVDMKQAVYDAVEYADYTRDEQEVFFTALHTVSDFVTDLTNLHDRIDQELGTMKQKSRDISLGIIPENVFRAILTLIEIPAVKKCMLSPVDTATDADLDRPYHVLYEIVQKALRQVSDGKKVDSTLMARVQALTEKKEYNGKHVDLAHPYPIDMTEATHERIDMSAIHLAEAIEDRMEYLPDELRISAKKVVSILRGMAIADVRAGIHTVEGFSKDEVSFVHESENMLADPLRFDLSCVPGSLVEALSQLGFVDHRIHLALLGHGKPDDKPLLYDAKGKKVDTLDHPYAYNPFSIAIQNTSQKHETGHVTFAEYSKMEDMLMVGDGHDMIEVASAVDKARILALLKGDNSIPQSGRMSRLWDWMTRWTKGKDAREEARYRAWQDAEVRKYQKKFSDVLDKLEKEDEYFPIYVPPDNTELALDHVPFQKRSAETIKKDIVKALSHVKEFLAAMQAEGRALEEHPTLMRAAIEILSHSRMVALDAELAAFAHEYSAIYDMDYHNPLKYEIGRLSGEERRLRLAGDLKRMADSYELISQLQHVKKVDNFFTVNPLLEHILILKTGSAWDYQSYKHYVDTVKKYMLMVDPAAEKIEPVASTSPIGDVSDEEKKRLKDILENVKQKWENLYYYPDRLASVEKKRGYEVADTKQYPFVGRESEEARGEEILDTQVLPDGRVVSLVGEGKNGKHQMLYGLGEESVDVTEKITNELKKLLKKEVKNLKISNFHCSPEGNIVFVIYYNIEKSKKDHLIPAVVVCDTCFNFVYDDIEITHLPSINLKKIQFIEAKRIGGFFKFTEGLNQGCVVVFTPKKEKGSYKKKLEEKYSYGSNVSFRFVPTSVSKDNIIAFDHLRNDCDVGSIDEKQIRTGRNGKLLRGNDLEITDFDILDKEKGEYVFVSSEGLYITQKGEGENTIDITDKIYTPENEKTQIIQVQAVGDRIFVLEKTNDEPEHSSLKDSEWKPALSAHIVILEKDKNNDNTYQMIERTRAASSLSDIHSMQILPNGKIFVRVTGQVSFNNPESLDSSRMQIEEHDKILILDGQREDAGV